MDKKGKCEKMAEMMKEFVSRAKGRGGVLLHDEEDDGMLRGRGRRRRKKTPENRIIRFQPIPQSGC